MLPYDREEYLDFFGYRFYRYTQWYGVSFQLPGGYDGRHIGLTEYMGAYEQWFKDIIVQLDNGSHWIVNHDRRAHIWFPYDENTLPSLRLLFRENHIPDNFKGALLFTKEDLLKFSTDIITYPFAVIKEDGVFYDDVDISHGQLPFIIKISAHRNIDLLSKDKKMLMEIVNKNRLPHFILREYYGEEI